MKQSNVCQLLELELKYANEKAVDTGGVCRDMLSAFWQEAFATAFDGRNVVVPSIHPHTNMDLFVTLGTIFSHGYISCGFLPVRVAFPTIAAAIHDTNLHIPNDIMLQSFQSYLSFHESGILREALSKCDGQVKSFTRDMVFQLISILDQVGCRQTPQPSNLKQLIVQLAQHEFITKPLGAVRALHSGIPSSHHEFWKRLPIERLFVLYNALSATPKLVLEKLIEPSAMKPEEQRVFTYLTSFIGNVSQEELTCFLRFVTGSSSLTANKISVSFNNMSGIGRRPISHTCSCVLELSTNYLSYLDFSNEFQQVLRSNESWAMDAL